jgi:hypothetical protein
LSEKTKKVKGREKQKETTGLDRLRLRPMLGMELAQNNRMNKPQKKMERRMKHE